MGLSPNSKRGLWIAGVLGVGVLGYGAAWYSATSVLKNQSARWIEAQERSGYKISHGAPSVSGFPARAIVTYPDWSMAAPSVSGPWTWRTAKIEVSAEPWSPLRFTVDLAGEHLVAGLWTPPGVPATISAAQANFRPDLTTEGRIAEITATVKEVLVSGIQTNKSLVGIESGSLSIVHTTDGETPLWRVNADLTNWHAPLLENPSAFGPQIRNFSLEAELQGHLPSGTLPDALKTWREGGGTLEVKNVTFDWPPLSMTATGTLALDDDLQPVGAMTATFRGFMETLGALAQQNTIEQNDADTAQAVLGLMSRKPAGGGAPELNISVTVQDKRLYLGPIALSDMPKVEWPKAILIP